MPILFLCYLPWLKQHQLHPKTYISMESKYLVNQEKKIKRTKSYVQYYSYYTATCKIILSGDIKTNPGTGLSEPKCKVCDKTV